MPGDYIIFMKLSLTCYHPPVLFFPELPLGLGSFHPLSQNHLLFKGSNMSFQCEFTSGKTLHGAGVCKVLRFVLEKTEILNLKVYATFTPACNNLVPYDMLYQQETTRFMLALM